MYSAGTVLKLDYGIFYHYGIADSLGYVIHNSKKHQKAVRESYDIFADGKEIFVSKITSDNLIQAVVNAQRYLGIPYNVIK